MLVDIKTVVIVANRLYQHVPGLVITRRIVSIKKVSFYGGKSGQWSVVC